METFDERLQRYRREAEEHYTKRGYHIKNKGARQFAPYITELCLLFVLCYIIQRMFRIE